MGGMARSGLTAGPPATTSVAGRDPAWIRWLVSIVALAFLGLFLVIPLAAVLLYPLIGLPVLLFQHANVRFPAAVDRRLAWVVSTPAMHLVHHLQAQDRIRADARS